MKEKYKIFRKVIKIGYLVLLAGMFLIVGLIYATRDDSKVKRGGAGVSMLQDGWTLDEAGTEPVELSKLGSYVDETTGQLTIYHRLPELYQTTGMIYRTKDISTKILVDNAVVYETNVAESPYYNRSPGNLWNVAYFQPGDSNKTMALQIFIVYDKKAVTLDSIYWGDPSTIIINTIREKLGAIIISLVMIVAGILIVVLGIITQKNLHNGNYGSFFLGIYAIILGIWSLLETNVLQFLVADMRIIQTLDNMMMIVGFLPLFIYMDYEHHVMDYLVTRVICILDFVYVSACVFLRLFGIKDFHDVLFPSQLFIMVGSLIVLYWVVVEWRKQWRENHKIELSLMLGIIGISVLLVITMFAIVQYTKADVADRAQWIRFGILFFVICFGSYNLLETYNLIAQGLRYEIMENLAYMDGLTGLGNRTAYLKQIDIYAKSRVENLGIVFMDVNNLKVVNDRYGHEKGDEFLKQAAGIIKESFGKAGHVYRMGGDEFCALISGPDTLQAYGEALKEFQGLVGECDRNNTSEVAFQIAQGFAYCENATEEKIGAATEQADKAMYADKEKQKVSVKRNFC